MGIFDEHTAANQIDWSLSPYLSGSIEIGGLRSMVIMKLLDLLDDYKYRADLISKPEFYLEQILESTSNELENTKNMKYYE